MESIFFYYKPSTNNFPVRKTLSYKTANMVEAHNNPIKNKTRSLLFLLLLSFVIFCLPFIQMCSQKQYNAGDEKEVAKTVETTLNAYQLGTMIFYGKSDFKDLQFYTGLCYTFIISFTIISLVFLLKNKFGAIRYISAINFTLMVCSIILLVVDKFIKNISDIKYGIVLFAINNFAIFIIAKEKESE